MSNIDNDKHNHTSSTPPCTNGQNTYEQLLKSLPEDTVPNGFKADVDGTLSSEESKQAIAKSNNDAANMTAKAFADARKAVIGAYKRNELNRADRQKPLLRVVVVLTVLQLIAFNGIIGVISYASFNTKITEVILQLFSILKYYIGATIVELIGMVWFITRDTFSLNHSKMMDRMFPNKPDSESAKRNIDS